MDAALREHANKVLNGHITPYKRLLDGATTLNLTLTVSGSSIVIEDADAPPPPPPDEEPVEKPTIFTVNSDEPITEETAESTTEKAEPKPSPRRRKKT